MDGVLQAWKKLDWTSTKSSMDALAASIEMQRGRTNATREKLLESVAAAKHSSDNAALLTSLQVELERAHGRGIEVESVFMAVRSKLGKFAPAIKDAAAAAANDDRKPNDPAAADDYGGDKDAVTCRLQRDLLKLRKQVADLEAKNKSLNAELRRESDSARVATDKLYAQRDYEHIKHELKIMKSMEFDAEGSDCEKSLEALLLERNKALQAENTSLKLTKSELEGRLGALLLTTGAHAASFAAFGAIANHYATQNAQTSVSVAPTCTSAAGAATGDLWRIVAQQSTDQVFYRVWDCPQPGISAEQAAPGGSADLPSAYANDSLEEQLDIESAVSSGKPRAAAEEEAMAALQRIVTDGASCGDLDTPLDTTTIATECKQLMAQHKMGQRVFAKVVLSQSQGSLSELLSKPKPWDQLTQRGREAFRRIAAWVGNERAIDLLRQLAKSRRLSQGGTAVQDDSDALPWREDVKSETNNVDENERQPVDVKWVPGASPSANVDKNLSNSPSRAASQTRSAGGSRWHHDDIPKEKIEEIYQRELAKLKEQDGNQNSAGRRRAAERVIRTSLPSSAQQHLGNVASAISVMTMAPAVSGPDIEPSPTASDSVPLDLAMRPMTNSPSTRGIAESTSSNLMQSFSNCDPASSMAAAVASQQVIDKNHEKTRKLVPHVTQMQLETYPAVDTEELVSRVKDYLANNTISQRQFGEHVLGLSQGSVSDLLARPKPWTMLTQKGREPFIRMHLFLQDELSQQKMRDIRAATVAMSTVNQMNANKAKVDSSKQSVNAIVQSTPISANGRRLVTPNGAGECTVVTYAVTTGDLNQLPQPQPQPQPQQQQLPHRAVSPSASPPADPLPLGEADELDTSWVAKQVREQLQANGIGQKLFGEAVLGVSQGTVSDLLSKAKPWSVLSVRGREPYARMKQWLDNPDRVDVVMRGRIDTPTGMQAGVYTKRKSPENDDGQPAKKIQRTVVTDEQKQAMLFAFAHNQYPPSTTVAFLAQQLELSTRTVTNWFYNRRCRHKPTAAELEAAKLLAPNIEFLYPALKPYFLQGGMGASDVHSASPESTAACSSIGHGADGADGSAPTMVPMQMAGASCDDQWRRGILDVLTSAAQRNVASAVVDSMHHPTSPNHDTDITNNNMHYGEAAETGKGDDGVSSIEVKFEPTQPQSQPTRAIGSLLDKAIARMKQRAQCNV